MKCKQCNGTNFEIMTTMTVSMPFEYYYKLTKKKMQSKDFKVWDVTWDTASFKCKDCGNTIILGETKEKET